jgi:arginine deiminase
MIKVGVNSEYEALNTLLIHKPGPEVENMTPATAERALYSDILNLPIAQDEFAEFKSVLQKVTQVIEVRELMLEVIGKSTAKTELIECFQEYSGIVGIDKELESLSDEEFTRQVIEGVPLPQVSLANFLHQDKYAINPLHNIFFMRDASFCIGNTIYISSMARSVRKPESLILDIIYSHCIDKDSEVCFINENKDDRITIEGGDVLVVSDEVLIIGIGARTTPEAVDLLVKKVSEKQPLKHVLVQELPRTPESFIHIDMVFTLLSESECMVYKPVLKDDNSFRTIKMDVDGGDIKRIYTINNLVDGLNSCGFDYKPIFCGGGDKLLQEREQWHSGANFFAFDSGKIIGYARNSHTSEALIRSGYEILQARDVIDSKVSVRDFKKCLITVDGSELARGGGGPRCMTMPVYRG